MDDSKDLLKYVLAGAIGFSLGGFYAYTAYPELRTPFEFGAVLRSAFFGVTVCGFFLGIASKSIINGIRLAIGGFVGFAIGSIIMYPLFIVMLMLSGGSETLAELIFLVVLGAIGGAFYGISLLNIKKIVIFTVAGGLGMSLGAVAGIALINQPFMSFMVFSIIIGASLGAGMYYAEKSTGVEKSV